MTEDYYPASQSEVATEETHCSFPTAELRTIQLPLLQSHMGLGNFG